MRTSLTALVAVTLLTMQAVPAGQPTAPRISIRPFADHGNAGGGNKDGVVQNQDRWEFAVDVELPFGVPDGEKTYHVDVALNNQWVALGGVIVPQCPSGGCTKVDVTTTQPNRLSLTMTPGPGSGGQYQTRHGTVRFSAVVRGDGSNGDTLDVRATLLINEHVPLERYPLDVSATTRLIIGQAP